jgi:hypothetical protein
MPVLPQFFAWVNSKSQRRQRAASHFASSAESVVSTSTKLRFLEAMETRGNSTRADCGSNWPLLADGGI